MGTSQLRMLESEYRSKEADGKSKRNDRERVQQRQREGGSHQVGTNGKKIQFITRQDKEGGGSEGWERDLFYLTPRNDIF